MRLLKESNINQAPRFIKVFARRHCYQPVCTAHGVNMSRAVKCDALYPAVDQPHRLVVVDSAGADRLDPMGPDAARDDALDAFAREKGARAYHPSCTCKMGTDEYSVVDAQGKLHGITGLRVVDASIMPNIVNGNLNAPVIMMAEKLADTIRGREPLPPSDAPVYESPDWRTRQR